jgi:hypothetical protein
LSDTHHAWALAHAFQGADEVADQSRRNYEDELRREGRRGRFERSGEEVRSWFSSDDPRVRRGNDERDDRFPYGGDRDRSWRDQGDGSYEHDAGRWRGGARAQEDYRGRGPKDYRRSDERIREEVSDRLTDDSHVDASDITVQVTDGEVTLTGTVATREQKRRAEDLIERTSGVRDVTNRLRVHRDAPAGLSTT